MYRESDPRIRPKIGNTRSRTPSTHEYQVELFCVDTICEGLRDTLVRFDDSRDVSEGDWLVASTPDDRPFAHLQVETVNQGPVWAAPEYIDSIGGAHPTDNLDELLTMLNGKHAVRITRDTTVRVLRFSVRTVVPLE